MSAGEAAHRPPRLGTLALLSTLYFVQGLPYGFQENALPAFMTGLGVSASGIGFAKLLAWPWLLKPLWAPLVDRYWHGGFGRRKSWIVPLQLLLAGACLAAGYSQPGTALPRLIVVVLVMNLLTATQDIAVDGFAVDRLGRADLGLGNSAQVVGYKLGMLVGGGLLWGHYDRLGWAGVFWVMAGCCVLGMVVLTPHAEGAGEAPVATPPLGWRELKERVVGALGAPGARWLLALVVTYKLGEALANAMFTPYLVQTGLAPQVVASWMGTWVMLASLGGSLFGGLLATRARLAGAVAVTAALRVVGLAGQWALVAQWLPVTRQSVVLIASLEHFFAGALTVCMFALMMSRVDRRIGATHYTVLAALEVFGKALPGALSGVLVDAIGYPDTFAAAVALSIGFVALALPARARVDQAPGA